MREVWGAIVCHGGLHEGRVLAVCMGGYSDSLCHLLVVDRVGPTHVGLGGHIGGRTATACGEGHPRLLHHGLLLRRGVVTEAGLLAVLHGHHVGRVLSTHRGRGHVHVVWGTVGTHHGPRGDGVVGAHGTSSGEGTNVRQLVCVGVVDHRVLLPRVGFLRVLVLGVTSKLLLTRLSHHLTWRHEAARRGRHHGVIGGHHGGARRHDGVRGRA